MSPMRIALIACANGLGHVRRMLALSLALRDQGASPTIFAPQRDVHHLALTYGVPLPDVVDFESRTARADWLAPDNGCWTNNLPALDNFDQVVSDNLIEVLAVRPDAWLSGTFFWHRALPNFPTQRAQRAENLLSHYRPRVIASEFFASPYLAEKTRLFSVGLFTLRVVDGRTGSGDLLISCGKGGEALSDAKAILERAASGPQPGPFTIWVEPLIYREKMPSWIQPASYTPAMYGRLSAAVIRPGIGTLTDCLAAGVRLFLFHEHDNFEMAHNANQIRKNKLGDVFFKVGDSWRAALDFVDAASKEARQTVQDPNIDFRGAVQAASILLGEKTQVSQHKNIETAV